MDKLTQQSKAYPEATDKLLAEIVDRIQSVGNPLKIVLFGSRARGDFSPTSDIDILIVEDLYVDSKTERARTAIYKKILQDVYPELTLLVRSVQEVEEWKYVPRYITTEALREGRVLYKDSKRYPSLELRTDGASFVAEESRYKNEKSNRRK